MSNQVVSDAEHQSAYAKAIRIARSQGSDAFHNWFNQAADVRCSTLRGYWDFALHILTPRVCRHISKAEDKVALEIGYGGGRLLNAACSYFREAIGVDIHDEQEAVAEFLRSQGKSNFHLITTSGRTIDVPDTSIDFVYSFIVLQHLPSFDVLVSYLTETYRCLRPGGVAQLYFGGYAKLPLRQQLQALGRGYREIPTAPVNHTSLVVRVGKVRALCTGIGFRVLETGPSYKRVPDGYANVRGGQDYATLLKV